MVVANVIVLITEIVIDLALCFAIAIFCVDISIVTSAVMDHVIGLVAIVITNVIALVHDMTSDVVVVMVVATVFVLFLFPVIVIDVARCFAIAIVVHCSCYCYCCCY